MPKHIYGLENNKPYLFCSTAFAAVDRRSLATWVDVCCGDVDYKAICAECVQVLAVSQETAKANNEFTLLNIWED